MIELVGNIPKMGKLYNEYFNRKLQLRRIHKLRYWRLKDVLYEKYQFKRCDCEEMEAFLMPFLNIEPGKRYVGIK
jgi:hypothetical protein